MSNSRDNVTETYVEDELSIQQESLYELVIVGGGPSGMSAALEAMNNGIKTLIIEQTVLGGQVSSIGNVKNYLGVDQSMSGEELSNIMSKQILNMGVDVCWDRVVNLKVMDEKCFIRTEKGKFLCAFNVIIACGLMPKKLNVSGESTFYGRGVSYSAVVDKDYFKNKTVTVVGGGNYAVAQALFLQNYASKVNLTYRHSLLKSTSKLSKEIDESDVNLYLNTYLDEIVGNTLVEAVKCKNVVSGKFEIIDTDSVVLCIGMKPRIDWLENLLKVDEKGFVLTDDHMKSSLSRIYAIGDVRSKIIRQISTAVSDGMVAVKSLMNSFD